MTAAATTKPKRSGPIAWLMEDTLTGMARRKALIWFLLLPWTLYAVELGLWMWLFEAFNAAVTETV